MNKRPFTWDPAKDAQNIRKHGISFKQAETIFDGSYPILTEADPSSLDEFREMTYGILHGTMVICVIHTDRNGITRIISARKATKHEERKYANHLRGSASRA